MASLREYHTIQAEIQTADSLPNSGFAEAIGYIPTSKSTIPAEAADKPIAEATRLKERDQYIMLSSLF